MSCRLIKGSNPSHIAVVPTLLTVALPFATAWVDEQRTRILRDGVPLTDAQCLDARAAGVREPARVRLLKVDRIPVPTQPILAKANDLVKLVGPHTAGIAFGYGIYLRADHWGSRPVIAHELVHVAQYERFGSSAAFLKAYLEECLTIGYPNGSLEQEAIAKGRDISA